MVTVTSPIKVGHAKKMGQAIVTDNLDQLVTNVADAKQMLEQAKEMFAQAEAEFLATGIDEANLSDGRKVTVVRSTVREIDHDKMEELVSRKAWKAISTESVVTRLLDAEILAGRLSEEDVADAINVKDRKPSVRVK
tara:strand:- start:1276 stop:1686 length:411 start_codon:yes stop_codon:yes gene_type:complete